MKLLKALKSAVVKHTLVALGTAVAAGLAVMPEQGAIEWRHIVIVCGGTLLSALGVGYAYRQAPGK